MLEWKQYTRPEKHKPVCSVEGSEDSPFTKETRNSMVRGQQHHERLSDGCSVWARAQGRRFYY